MRLLPRSLFGRLVLVLLGGLVVAQLLSAAINYAERSEQLMYASGIQSAQRVADAAKLLDSLGLGRAPARGRDPQRAAAARDARSRAARRPREGGADPRLERFRDALRDALGDGREIRVSMREAPAASQAAFERRHQEMMRRGRGPGMGPGMNGPGMAGVRSDRCCAASSSSRRSGCPTEAG